MKKVVTKTATVNGDFHRVDTQGNYFINSKCVNPRATLEGNEIGYNIPDLDWVEHETNIGENIWLSRQKS